MGSRVKPSKDIADRQAIIQSLMLAGCTLAQCIVYGRGQHWSRSVVEADYRSINDDWQKQSDEEIQAARTQAIQRLRSDLAEMRTDLRIGTKGGKGAVKRVDRDATYKDIAAHENLLAKIEGTLRPIEVKVNIGHESRRALIDVINSLSQEDMDQMVAEQRALEARARAS